MHPNIHAFIMQDSVSSDISVDCSDMRCRYDHCACAATVLAHVLFQNTGLNCGRTRNLSLTLVILVGVICGSYMHALPCIYIYIPAMYIHICEAYASAQRVQQAAVSYFRQPQVTITLDSMTSAVVRTAALLRAATHPGAKRLPIAGSGSSIGINYESGSPSPEWWNIYPYCCSVLAGRSAAEDMSLSS